MVLSIVLAAGLSAAATTSLPSKGTEDAAARQWLQMIDRGSWPESWAAAGAMFRSRLTAEAWAASVQPVRQPLGALIDRVVANLTRTRTLPGAPDGDYAVLQYRSRFAQKAEARETVVLAREGSDWRVNGYFIR
jgi:hypothetical protein